MNRLQKATVALIALFGTAFLDGLFALGFSDTFYVFLGTGEIIALYFFWRIAFPKK